MISPTVGRVVWYWPEPHPVEQPWAALVAYVHDARCINIGGFDRNGVPFSRTSVQLLQDDDVPRGGCCTWMPYQKGQAAKTEALEAEAEQRALPKLGRPKKKSAPIDAAPAMFKCAACGERFGSEKSDAQCPSCGSFSTDVLPPEGDGPQPEIGT